MSAKRNVHLLRGAGGISDAEGMAFSPSPFFSGRPSSLAAYLSEAPSRLLRSGRLAGGFSSCTSALAGAVFGASE